MAQLTPITMDTNTAIASKFINDKIASFEELWKNMKFQWTDWWNPTKQLADLQIQTDLVAANGNMAILQAVAAAEIAIIQTYRPDLFAQCIPEVNGMLQPNSQPYLMYAGPARYWTVDNTKASGRLYGLPVVFATV